MLLLEEDGVEVMGFWLELESCEEESDEAEDVEDWLEDEDVSGAVLEEPDSSLVTPELLPSEEEDSIPSWPSHGWTMEFFLNHPTFT